MACCALLISGCASPSLPSDPWGDGLVDEVTVELPEDSMPSAAIPPGWSGGVTAVGSVHPAVRHGSVELPAVSPDGRWVAFFDHAEGTPRPTPDSLISGRGLQGVSLWVRRVDEAGGARPAALEGACWPSWSGDASALFFVTYDAQRRCYLGRFDVATGKVQRKAVGLRHMLQVSANHDGSRLAVVGYANVPDEAGVFVVDWERADAVAVPSAGGVAGPQVLPAWASPGDLLFVELSGAEPGARNEAEATLCTWRLGSVGSGLPTVLADLQLPGGTMDAVLMQQGLPAAFNAARGAWMYRDARGVTRVVALSTGDDAALPGGTSSAVWWDGLWVVAGGPSELEVVAADPAAPAQDQAGRPSIPVRLRLLSGRWAPRYADVQRGSMVLVGMGENPDLLAVYQLWVVVGE